MSQKKSPTTRATEIGMACTSGAELRSIIDSLKVMLKVRFPETKEEPPPAEEKRPGGLIFAEDPSEYKP